MRLGIKGKQVLGVTTIVALIVAGLSLMHLASWRAKLDESPAVSRLLANAVYHRARGRLRQRSRAGPPPTPAFARSSNPASTAQRHLCGSST
jgi:hypothetical protein